MVDLGGTSRLKMRPTSMLDGTYRCSTLSALSALSSRRLAAGTPSLLVLRSLQTRQYVCFVCTYRSIVCANNPKP